ncbi:hypothetical protein [Hoyosella altamirensis]|uniref:Bacterial spore germination immunoglobulin-like domain-containing protein n=1 Tax=Hoyosella altamirensis TaxID=616997 RepID=A0A839RHU1_9ACTN|nr:hypothetical protein [Hoyosella altamirensis]MBB3036342.1 hypothetical protein [Hoyosella altamirensis]
MARSAAALVSCAVLIAGLAACGTDTDTDPPAPVTTAPTTEAAADGQAPPPIRVRAGDVDTELEPWTYCWIDRCVDGEEPEDPLSIGSPDSVTVDFAGEAAEFVANFREAGSDECGRNYETDLQENPDGTFTLEPVGLAGEYDVLLVVRAPEGDAAVMFRWDTPEDGAVPEPQAALAIASEFAPLSMSFPDLTLTDLRADPQRASVAITITSADGVTQTIESEATPTACPEGSLRFFTEETARSLEDGQPPHRYEVRLQLDDEVHEATAEWPADAIGGAQPYVNLEFTPPLPTVS